MNCSSKHTGISKRIYIKAIRFFLLLFFTLNINLLHISAQAPNWVAGTPSIASTGPLSITVNFGIDIPGTVYICIWNYNTAELTAAYIKSRASYPEVPPLVANDIIPVAAGDAGKVLQVTFNVINANTLHSVWLVAESSGGTLQATATRVYATTLPCPKVQLFTFFGNVGECVNTGATGQFQAAPLGMLPTGVLKEIGRAHV